MKMTSMEDDLNGRQHQWKTTSMEDDLNGKKRQLKMTPMDVDPNGRQPLSELRKFNFNTKCF